jgi:hypothetical protein
MSRSKARRLADLIKANLDRLTVDTTTNAVNILDNTDTEVEVVEAGSGVSLDGKTVSLDIDGLTAESSIASTDLISVHDVSAGTAVKSTIADAVSGVNISELTNDSGYITSAGVPTNVSAFTNDSGYITGNQTITLTGDASGSGTTSIAVTVANDSHSHSNYLPLTGGTMTGELQLNSRLDVGNGTNSDHEVRIYKADNNVSDHIQFYNGTTRVGEIGCEDTTWLRINQETAKNIYTPRYFRADGGLYVDGVSRIQSGGNQYLNVTYNSTGSGGIRLYDSGGVIQGYLYGSGGGEFGLLDNDGSWAFRARTGSNANEVRCNNNDEFRVYTSYTLSVGSCRSPIFYDSNSTTYYLDPSSTGTSIRCAGNITAYYSDERLKDIEGNIPDALDKVNSLNGFYYTANEKAQKLGYKAKREVGVSAQEVEAILPELVKDAPIGHGYKTIDYSRLTPLLIEAVKELSEKVEVLTAKVEELEDR